MRRGSHASGDRSFARSNAVNVGRGAALIAVAFVIGLLLLQQTDDLPRVDTSSERPLPTLPPTTELTPATTRATATTVANRLPKDVKVLAINGTKTSGAASRIARPLQQAGYNVLAPVDASAAVKASLKASSIYYTPGYDKEAKAMAQIILLPVTQVLAVPNPPIVSDTKGANVLVLVGPDLAARTSGGTTATSSTASTLRGTFGASTTTSTTARFGTATTR